jgi:hypothetical protein
VFQRAFENSEVHIVVVCDRPARSAVFALYHSCRVALAVKGPDTAAEALTDAMVCAGIQSRKVILWDVWEIFKSMT